MTQEWPDVEGAGVRVVGFGLTSGLYCTNLPLELRRLGRGERRGDQAEGRGMACSVREARRQDGVRCFPGRREDGGSDVGSGIGREQSLWH